MYSYEERMKAVKLYIKYDLCAADTIRELGYPSRKMLVRWYKEYQECFWQSKIPEHGSVDVHSTLT